MAYVTRAMRGKAVDDQHERLDGARLAQCRRIEREAGLRAVTARELAFPVLDGANVDRAMRFQERRRLEVMLEMGHGIWTDAERASIELSLRGE